MKTRQDNAEKDLVIKSIKAASEMATVMKDTELKLTAEETPNLCDAAINNPEFQQLIDKLSHEKSIPNDEFAKKEDLSRFYSRLAKADSQRKYKTLRRKLYVAATAAAVAVIVVVQLFFVNHTHRIIDHTSENNIMLPTMVLSDGKNLSLSSDEVVFANNYSDEKQQNSTTTTTENYNTIIVPSGTTLKIVLEDSTLVTLNANSQLKYPVPFTGDIRRVFLKGEAYFEVAKTGTKFEVMTDDVNITVYGTSFNVSAREGAIFETILVSGSVGLTQKNNLNETRIIPNQKYTFDKTTNESSVENADPEILLVWMSGYMACHNEPISRLFEKLSAWYGVKFEVDSRLDLRQRVTISLNHDLTVEEMLTIIESTLGLGFTKKSNIEYSVKQLTN